MNFGALSAKYLQLRQRLAIHFGPTALADITIPPPSGSSDELSFIRLVGWVYVLLQETGKVPLNFLKQLPPISSSEKILPEVERLRTWSSHNLYLSKDNDLKTLKIAQGWFKRCCGVGTPNSENHWDACFSKLCADTLGLLTNAIEACDALDSDVDGSRLIADLQRRLNRNWEAYRFDTYVQSAVAQLGFSGFDLVSFRKRHLDNWRALVMSSEETGVDRLLTLRIESDVLRTMADALPSTAQVSGKTRTCWPNGSGCGHACAREAKEEWLIKPIESHRGSHGKHCRVSK